MWLTVAVWLAGCSPENFDRPGAGGNEALYTSIYPYYAEFCALSQIKKKPGFGADIRGQIGGHSVFYLSDACRDPGTDYPVLRLCDGSADVQGADAQGTNAQGTNVQGTHVDEPQDDGVGISMNEHFSNAKWVAIPGRDFFFDGGLPRDHGLTRADYVDGKAQAKQLGIYRGVTFQPWVFDDKHAGVSQEDWKYEVSIGTDYAISFARGRFCARVPVTRAQTARMITFLNAQNAPYRDGKEVFVWSVFQDNCIHLAHNALAAAGVWDEWPIDMPLPFAIFDFPVPKNELVNLVQRIDDPPDLDLMAIYHDETAAQSLAQFGRLPWLPGAVIEARPPQRPNKVYDTDVALVFYDDPITGRYRRRFDAMLGNPRYVNVEQNLEYFAATYRRLSADRKPLDTWLAEDQFRTPAERQRFTDFYHRFYAYLDHEHIAIDAKLARLTVAARTDGVASPTVHAAIR
jgi:hypothetical protein